MIKNKAEKEIIKNKNKMQESGIATNNINILNENYEILKPK
jgi:hypothetical protein